jgi:hypothetical protein
MCVRVCIGSYLFHIYRCKVRVHTVLHGPTPFQRWMRRAFPCIQPAIPPLDARSLGTLSLPFPEATIDIAVYRHLQQ